MHDKYALADKVRRDRKLQLLGRAVADFEREFGEITAEETVAQQRLDREHATVVRGRRNQNRQGKQRTA